MDDLRQAIFNAIDTYDLTKDRGALQEELFAALQARAEELEIACAQAVVFAEYVEEHAKGKMEAAAKHYLSLPYSQELATRLKSADAAIDALGGGESKP